MSACSAVVFYLYSFSRVCLCGWQVKLTDSLMSGTTFSPGKEAELAWVDGQISVSANSVDSIPVLGVLPQNKVIY